MSSLLQDPALTRARRYHLAAVRAPGSGAWLTATSASPDTQIPSPLFRTALRRRLRMPIWDSDTACGLCGEVLDRWGDHAICCSGRGDMVLRHNAVRNIVCSAVSECTSVSPELEKPGLLLPPRPPDPGGSCPGLIPDQLPLCSAGRRPADVWSPVESRASLRPGTFRSHPSSVPPFSPPLSHLWLAFFTRLSPVRTPSRTPPARFPPWVPPSARSSWRLAAGGWSHVLGEVIGWVSSESRAMRGSTSDTPSDISLRIAQRISCTLHKENARAILRRSPGLVNGSYDLTGDLVSGSAR